MALLQRGAFMRRRGLLFVKSRARFSIRKQPLTRYPHLSRHQIRTKVIDARSENANPALNTARIIGLLPLAGIATGVAAAYVFTWVLVFLVV